MKPQFYKISQFFLAVIVLTLIVNPICWARTAGEPVVIRKKIIESTGEAHKYGMPEVKPDLSIPQNGTWDEYDIDVGRAYAKNRIAPYDPANKIDPFKPRFEVFTKTKPEKPTHVGPDREPSTELEKIDLSQLKLTGIITAASGNKAMVREASGKGHVISTGTYIGIQGGRVAEVLKDRVFIKELMEDVTGRLFYRNTEMKLHNS
jgi:Tfp pilus assembly protein PilP